MPRPRKNPLPENYDPSRLTPVESSQLRKISKAAPLVCRIDGWRMTLPVDVSTISAPGPDGKPLYVFVSVPSTSVIMGRTGDGYEPIKDGAEKSSALSAIRKAGKAGGQVKGGRSVALPDEVLKVLAASIPPGYRLVYEDGRPTVAKLRPRGPKPNG